MAFNANYFRSSLVYDGARPNLFDVFLTFPATTVFGQFNSAATNLSRFMVKATQLPGSTIGSIPMHYMGREVKFAGNRTFADWTVTIVNDESNYIRSAFEQWMDTINTNKGNARLASALRPDDYQATAVINQYGKIDDVSPTVKYTMVGMFPVDITPIELDWSSNDSIEEFSVTFAYQYWESSTRFGGQITNPSGLSENTVRPF